jgi:hypothetical protein
MSLKALDLIQNAKLPDDLTVLDRLVLTIYANKHIDELGKAIIKRPELERQTGTHSKSVCRSINRLTKIGALIHITKGFPGQMAEYGINYKWLNNYQVTGELPKTRNRVSKSYRQEPGQLPTGDLTVTDRPPDGYPILKDLNTQIRNKENDYVFSDQVKTETKDAPSGKINYDRWNVIKPYLGEFEKYIKPGPNYERLLNRLEDKGVRLKDIGAFIEKIDFTNAYSCGGRLEQELNALAGVSKATTKPGATDWCGREGCDPTARTWGTQWEIEGRFTFNCPKCHPNEIKKDEQKQTFNFLDELGETPFKSVDE